MAISSSDLVVVIAVIVVIFRLKRAGSWLVVVDCSVSLSTGAVVGGRNGVIAAVLWSAVDMHVVPHLAEDSTAIVKRALTRSSLVVAWTAAADVWNGASLLGQGIVELREGVPSLVGWLDAVVGQHVVSRELLVVLDHSLEEVNNILVLSVFGTVAWDIEGAEASGVLAELVLRSVSEVLTHQHTHTPQKS